MAEPRISVVIPTYQRPAACAAAVEGALAQAPEPLEVLVCDDGSSDETQQTFQDWAARDPRVRYLRLDRNTGTPGPARSLGAEQARGEWVAFLDDDDAYLPGKLARQIERASEGDVDVIATNAILPDGSLYFPDARAEWRPSRDDVIADNPLIVSSVMVRRTVLATAGPFRPERWARGVADYAMWLRLADRGARFVVLPEPLVEYENAAGDRMSARPIIQETAVARLAWSRWRERPGDRARLRAAVAKSRAALSLLGGAPQFRRVAPIGRGVLLILRTAGYRALWLADRVGGSPEARQEARTARWYADPSAHVRRIDFPLAPSDRVFDVGGYTGEWAAELYARLRCRIEIFEPVDDFAARIDDRFGPNDDIRVHRYGLGASTGDELMSVEGARSSSVQGFGTERSTQVRIRDVVEALDELAPDGLGLLKLNIEGGEFDLLDRLVDADRMKDVRYLLVQFHDHVPHAGPRRAAIQAALAATHEQLWDFPFVWEAWVRRTTLT